MTLAGLALRAGVLDRARELGFDRAAVGPATQPPTAEHFERWLDAGYAGSMSYLERTRAERTDLQRLLPGCRSVVAVALGYARPDDGAAWRPVARYARGRDYHDVMRPRLRALVAFLAHAAGARSRAAVDTSAVLERDLAAQAGLGWIAKSTNLIAPGLGSYFLIGIVLTTADIPGDGAVPDRCGTCTACLEACPTQAFVSPYVLDARRCISYLTIEHRGAIDPTLRPSIGGWAFGCDVCQEVCPWNRRAPTAADAALAPATPLESLAELATMDERVFRARFRGTALWRTRRAGLARNAAIALGNQGERDAAEALRAAAQDVDPVVADAARWALERLGSARLEPTAGGIAVAIIPAEAEAGRASASGKEPPAMEHQGKVDRGGQTPPQKQKDQQDQAFDDGRKDQQPPVQLEGESDDALPEEQDR